ncbi:DUF2380 domain-containing protein [Bradyrhizobium sp. 180]|uniref:DUF3280 domain-containing protein n=1 Tax=unclassified Bradyrhizobium TaxID=2631580 RepID=UPI001FFA8954|nr:MULTISPECIES: DUF3280 domain-containing protein [unclassified Bradyrhizobium]MCK1419260.1 DUF2380 domain-containing protein [Bradyrhizobium sp. CW12]MCK1494479.1 DUF2380 domain-containing protein [Bradyrhizobium sp. 180]MCK1526921.1 DUF2380 domain-containing protein [Bradyrhizobium sp. 182]MCK1595345.1 DUF2380 domain-containing protein [Bradyrhizobium sp. 164]MCK1620260.1 DUF2380 domain-containing protein [Bradyrhizobium sp. 159]
MHCFRLILSAFFLFGLSSSRADAEAAIGVAMDDFSYTDTSGEPANQTAAHERRLSAFMAALRRDIGTDRRYRLLRSAEDGAAFKVVGGIQKTSTLVQWAKVAVIDVGAKRLVMDKLYTFRGDNDESWERAEIFVSREVMAALATPAPVALAVFDFELEDMTAASAIVSASDASYLAEVSAAVREALGHSGRYRIVDVGGGTARTGALRDCGGCEAAIAQKLGADLSLIGVVRRVSRTEYTLGFQVRDAKTGAVVARGDSGLRLGADYSWKRGAVRLVSDRLIESQQATDAPRK